MGNIIKIKAGSGVPTTSDIVDREIAFNRSDNKLYINDSGTIVNLSGAQGGGSADEADRIVFDAQAGEALSKGDVVYISGITGNTPIVNKADADDANKMPSFGLASSSASLNSSVQIVTFGTLENLDTSAFTVGDTVFVSTTAGGLTATAPTGESGLIQNMGHIVRSHASTGAIKLVGAGRSAATPNLNEDKIFLGNSSNQSVSTALSSIGLSKFNNDSGFTTNTGTVSFNGSTANGLLTYGNSTTADVEQNLTFTGSALSVTGTANVTSTISTDYGVRFNNGNTDFMFYNNTGDNLLYLRDLTNSQMLQTWTTSSTTIHKNLSVSGNVNATGDINVSDDVILNVNGNFIYSRDASGTLTRMFGMNSGNTTYIGPIDSYAGGSVVYGISSNVLAHYFYTDGAIRMKLDGPVLDIPNTGDWSFIKNNTNSGGLRFGTKDSGGTYANQIEISNTGNYVKLNEDVQLPATKKLYLDGGSDTYIHEPSGNQIGLVTGGNTRVLVQAHKTYINSTGANGLVINNDEGATANSGRIFFEGTSTSAIFQSGSALSFRSGATTGSSSGTQKFYIDTSGATVVGNLNVTGNSFMNYGLVVNDGGNDADFRVESVNNPNMLKVDASADAVLTEKLIDSATHIGTVGGHGLDGGTLSTTDWANFPVGYRAMIRNSNGTTYGSPVNNHGYFLKVANRDTGGGWGGIWVGYSTGENYLGRTSTSGSYASWEKIWTSANDGSGSTLDADLLDGLHGSSYWSKGGSWVGDLGSNGYTRVQGVSNGGGEFVLALKNSQLHSLIDGSYFAYEGSSAAGGGFWSSYNSAYGNATGFKATGTSTIAVTQQDGGSANLEVTGTAKISGSGGYTLGNVANQIRIQTNGSDTFSFLNTGNGYASGNFQQVYTASFVQAGSGVQIWDATHGFKSVLLKDSTYTKLLNNDGAVCAYFGDSGDRSNYFDSVNHRFRSADGGTYFGILNSTGLRIGTGNTSASYRLDVVGDARITSGSLGVGVTPNATDGRGDFSNDVVAYSTSDKRLKQNIKPLDNALGKVLKISGVEFDWKELTEEEKKTIHGNQGHDVGVIAQEVEEVLPEVVTTRDTGYKAVKYEKIVPLLIEAMKEQQQQINELKEKLNG